MTTGFFPETDTQTRVEHQCHTGGLFQNGSERLTSELFKIIFVRRATSVASVRHNHKPEDLTSSVIGVKCSAAARATMRPTRLFPDCGE